MVLERSTPHTPARHYDHLDNGVASRTTGRHIGVMARQDCSVGLWVTRRRWWIVAGAVAGLIYAVLASRSRPFTWAADVVTAVPIVAAASATLWANRNRAARIAGQRAGAVSHQPRWDRRWLTWVALSAVVTSWELYCFANLPRAQHPTLSSLIDLLDSTWVGKSVAFASWLALGWFLVAR
jgi:hypothetical protein